MVCSRPQHSHPDRFVTKDNTSHRTAPAAQHPIGVLLADDHPALRAGLRSLLSTEPDIHVVGESGSGEEAYARYRAHRPDVVVMDLSMEGMGGMEALRRIVKHDSAARILVYSVFSTEAMLDRALSLGALGYVTKANDTELLIDGIREVARGCGFVSPDLIHVMVRRHASRKRSLLEQLSDKEFQILVLTARGLQAEACGQALSLSEKTVRNHLTKLKAKLGVVDTAGLVLLAVRAGLVEP